VSRASSPKTPASLIANAVFLIWFPFADLGHDRCLSPGEFLSSTIAISASRVTLRLPQSQFGLHR
jgi:hypothetical protein